MLKSFKVDFYKKADGLCPVKVFLDSLDNKMRAKVLRLIMLLEKNGNNLREPYSKSLVGGIFEVRTNQGNNTARVLYFFLTGQKIILTNGFVKKTVKTPSAEIRLARKYRSDYLNRGSENNE